MSRALRIRRGRLSDCAAVARVMRSAIRHLAQERVPPRQIAAWSSLPALYHAWAMTAGGEAYLVAERRGRVVGYGARRGGEVTALFVAPAAAGTGVGTALLARIASEARRSGARALTTLAALHAASFYRSHGFSGGRRIRVPLPGGVGLAALLLERPLAARRGTSVAPPGRVS